MKLVMYHYVKKEKKNIPFLNSLALENFKIKLNSLKKMEKFDNINYQHSKKTIYFNF